MSMDVYILSNGIQDVVTFQGVTLQETAQAFEASVEDYLAFCRAEGVDPKIPE